MQKLKDANVAVYPVDAAGTKGPWSRREPMRVIAEQTGGIAYYQRNDIDVAIREAMDDGRVSYTLGFYESGALGSQNTARFCTTPLVWYENRFSAAPFPIIRFAAYSPTAGPCLKP